MNTGQMARAIVVFAKGNFVSVNNWLRENVHGPSRILTPASLIQKVTGEKLSAQYFLTYLNEKYSDIYGFEDD